MRSNSLLASPSSPRPRSWKKSIVIPVLTTIVVFKIFDFNSLGSISFTDLECLLTYGIMSLCKLHDISLNYFEPSFVKENLLDLDSNSRTSLKQLTRILNHRLIAELLHQFDIPSFTSSKNLDSFIDELSALRNEPYNPSYIPYMRKLLLLSSQPFTLR